MKIIIGSDHAGFELKEVAKSILKKEYEVEDLTPSKVPDDDYPDTANKVGKKVVDENTKGLLVCGSGIGICMAANKIKGVRAATVRTQEDATMSRRHNDANIICLGGRVTKAEDLPKILSAFFSTGFDGDKEEGRRHRMRVEKISQLEGN